MLAVCVDFEIDLASLDAFLIIMKKIGQIHWPTRLVVINSTLHKTSKTHQRYFFMNFMMIRLLLSCIKRQAIISNSMLQSAEWLTKNESACFRKLTTNLGLNVRKFVLSTLKILAVPNKLAFAEI